MLYAGTTWLYFKYSLLNDIVTKLKYLSLSAGNWKGSSETLRNNSKNIYSNENIKNISIHIPTHLKPLNNNQFGYYLAGLIDSDGYFDKNLNLTIVFHILDIPLAYYIKSYIGYGSVKKIKNKNACIYNLTKKEGIEKILLLINGKIRSESKYNQIKNNIKFPNINFVISSNDNLNNHWLCGFSDADASFQIKILNRKNRIEIRLNYKIDQKNKELLLLIQSFFGGNIGHRNKNNTWYYESTSFGSAKKIINYFDKYHLLSSKYLNYIKWRKTYIYIQNKKNLTKEGIEKIKKYKNSMNNFNKDSFYLE